MIRALLQWIGANNSAPKLPKDFSFALKKMAASKSALAALLIDTLSKRLSVCFSKFSDELIG